MKSLYEYLDYRVYLNDYYLMRKSEWDGFSMRFFGSKIDVDFSYLSRIFKKQRHLSSKSQQKLFEYLSLPTNEEHYLQMLILFNKAKKEGEKALFFEKLLALRPSNSRNIERSQYQFFSEWYYSSLRSLLEYYVFRTGDSFQKLGEQLVPKISATQAKAAIELLLDLKLIVIDETGRHILNDKSLSTGEVWHSIAINNYQKKVIEVSASAIDNFPRTEYDISTVTMNIAEEQFTTIQKMMREFRSQVIEYVNQSEFPNQTYQLNMQMFPVSVVPKEEGENE